MHRILDTLLCLSAGSPFFVLAAICAAEGATTASILFALAGAATALAAFFAATRSAS